MTVLLSLSIALTAGLLVSRFVKKIKLPAVTGYLIAGILVGPYVLGQIGIPGLGFVSHSFINDLKIISEVALGFIAFAIGNEFRVSQLKKIGKQATVIAILQGIAAAVCVDCALIALHFAMPSVISLPAAIILGAIATATAPAATLMVVRQYKAKGPLTDMLLPVVALDDAVGLVVFSISFGVAKAIGGGNFSILSVIVNPLLEVICSLLLGLLMGFIFTLAEKYFESNSKRLCLAVTFVMMTVALSMLEFKIGEIHIAFSSLLVCMMLGTVFCNICSFSGEMMEKTDKWTAPLFVLFFVLSGAELDLVVFANISVIVIGLVYILSRSLGKIGGAYFSAKLVKCSPSITKWLGITLLPQAGVALGMSITAMQFGEDGKFVRNIVLFGVLIYELVGPLLTKIALTKAGDIHPKAKAVVTDEDDDD